MCEVARRNVRPTAGSSALFQVRAWAGNYTNFEQAVLDPHILLGQSALFTNQTGNPLASPPAPPVSLLEGGLSGFALGTILTTTPTNKSVNCGANWTFDPPNAFDPCAGTNTTAWILSTVTNTLGPCTQFCTRTWAVATSCSTNILTCSQTVTLACSNCAVLAVSLQCPPHPVPPGGILAYTATVTNVGSAVLTGVRVVNDQPAPNTLVYGPATLTPGAGARFSVSYQIPPCSCGPIANTLTATGVSIYGGGATNSVTAICAGTNVYAPAGDLNGDGVVDQNELNAVLANYWASSPWVYMTNALSLGGGFFQFALTNATGWNFTVLASTNLADWTNLSGPAYPAYQFYDPEAASNAPVRNYRLRWP